MSESIAPPAIQPRVEGQHKLWILVAVQVLLLPLVLAFDSLVLPRGVVEPLFVWEFLRWTVLGVGWAPFLLLGFWCGLGTSHFASRIAGGTLGAAYLAAAWMYWERVAVPWSLRPIVIHRVFAHEPWEELLVQIAFFALFVAALLVVRNRVATLSRVAISPSPTQGQLHFSIWHMLLIIFLVALVLGLMRAEHEPWTSTSRFWREWGRTGLRLTMLFICVLCSAWATLAKGPVAGRFVVALCIATLAALSYRYLSTFSFEEGRRLASIIHCLVLNVGPMFVVSASLLVVRSCGFRLIPKVSVATRL
jgi:hypothetical protein